jgi:hypothetical protein
MLPPYKCVAGGERRTFARTSAGPATLRTLEAGSGTEEESSRDAAAIQMRGSEESAELSQELSAGSALRTFEKGQKCEEVTEKEGR